MNHHTIKNTCSFKGVGIHSGKDAQLTLHPAPLGSGITFLRTDINETLQVNETTVQHTPRATALSNGKASIKTPEHLMAALYALKISNITIHCNSEEIPILDGSAKKFIEGILENGGTQNQKAENTPIILDTPIIIEEESASIIAIPSKEPSFIYFLNYPNTIVGQQSAKYSPSQDSFLDEIAAARTFGFYAEIQTLIERGLGKGGNLDNALVIGEKEYLSPLRFPNECARHKCLDLIGDLWILQRPINACIVGIKSGHKQSMEMVKAISQIQ